MVSEVVAGLGLTVVFVPVGLVSSLSLCLSLSQLLLGITSTRRRNWVMIWLVCDD